MTKEDVLAWLILFGRDWVQYDEVSRHITPKQKIKWAFDTNYLLYKPIFTGSGNNKYKLSEKALALLND
jgi:hypothetical protein